LLYEKLDQLERPEAPARKVVAPEARLFDYDYEGNWINFGSYEDDIP
jgi:hypothetical protein